MKMLSSILIVLGVYMTLTALAQAGNAPDVSYMMGTFLPGIIAFIVGLKLREPKSKAPPPDDDFDWPTP